MNAPNQQPDARAILLSKVLRATSSGNMRWQQQDLFLYEAEFRSLNVSIESIDQDDVAPYRCTVRTPGVPDSMIESIYRRTGVTEADELVNQLLRALYEAARASSVSADPGLQAALRVLDDIE